MSDIITVATNDAEFWADRRTIVRWGTRAWFLGGPLGTSSLAYASTNPGALVGTLFFADLIRDGEMTDELYEEWERNLLADFAHFEVTDPAELAALPRDEEVLKLAHRLRRALALLGRWRRADLGRPPSKLSAETKRFLDES